MWPFLIRKTLYNAYKKWSKNIEIDIEEYTKMKEADPKFYREASSLQYGKVYTSVTKHYILKGEKQLLLPKFFFHF
ncbi:hypothetical protein CsSME_00037362 [Camellia sinensis var. sinensis]